MVDENIVEIQFRGNHDNASTKRHVRVYKYALVMSREFSRVVSSDTSVLSVVSSGCLVQYRRRH